MGSCITRWSWYCHNKLWLHCTDSKSWLVGLKRKICKEHQFTPFHSYGHQGIRGTLQLLLRGCQTSDKSDLVSPLDTYMSDIIGTLSTSIKAQKRENISKKRFELEWGG